MSAPVGSQTSRTAIRVGAAAHRYAGVIGTTVDDLIVVGVRADDDDRRVGDALLMSMQPGQTRTLQSVPFSVRAVGGSVAAPLLLDELGVLWLVSMGDTPPVPVLDDTVTVVDVFARRGDGSIMHIDTATPRPLRCSARALGRADDGVVIVSADALIGLSVSGEQHWRVPLPAGAFGDVTAVVADGSVVGVVADRTLHIVHKVSGDVRRLPVPAGIDGVARLGERWFLGSPDAGLHTLDDDDDRVRLWRPSLRAHQMIRMADGLVVVSDLFVATTDDGVDIVSRDLSSFVRLVDRRG